MDDKEWTAGLELALNDVLSRTHPQQLAGLLTFIRHLGKHLPVAIGIHPDNGELLVSLRGAA